MEELSLTIQGIKNKVQKLALRNLKLQERIAELEGEKRQLEALIVKEKECKALVEQVLVNNVFGQTVDKVHSKQAKQKINEMLREIDKCYALLNR